MTQKLPTKLIVGHRRDLVFSQFKARIEPHSAVRLGSVLVLLHHVFALLVVQFFKLALRLREEVQPAPPEFTVRVGGRLFFLFRHFRYLLRLRLVVYFRTV